jgi:hypothetical protein
MAIPHVCILLHENCKSCNIHVQCDECRMANNTYGEILATGMWCYMWQLGNHWQELFLQFDGIPRPHTNSISHLVYSWYDLNHPLLVVHVPSMVNDTKHRLVCGTALNGYNFPAICILYLHWGIWRKQLDYMSVLYKNTSRIIHCLTLQWTYDLYYMYNVWWMCNVSLVCSTKTMRSNADLG